MLMLLVRMVASKQSIWGGFWLVDFDERHQRGKNREECERKQDMLDTVAAPMRLVLQR